ncbi:hypothetical protein PMM47T1_13550 [Pseudomonas sp. M47T1]|uniref:hypothetical protein n=1 Tax=unclassified Pseudomonas TaxID=196821 RepID=UPI0002608029|nr:hypothetical protein [Pseudomonas sp. M47T1]EIK95988.1 hypothetical protein PMM47T1_13550 [Pseudomonas sp. M47T1]
MKRMLGCGLLLLAGAISFQASAADTQTCDANIQRLQDRINSAGTTDPKVHELVDKDIADATAARDEGKVKDCIEITDRVKSRLDKYNK